MNPNPGIKDKLSTRAFLNGSAPRICAYAGCLTTLSDDILFRYCEVCRPLAAAQNITHALDPFSPLSASAEVEVPCHTLLTELTGEEILNHQKKIELYYLEVCKIVKLKGLEPSKTKVFQTQAEFVETVRANNERGSIKEKITKKSTNKKETKIDKLIKMGMSRSEATKWMEDEDLGF